MAGRAGDRYTGLWGHTGGHGGGLRGVRRIRHVVVAQSTGRFSTVGVAYHERNIG